MSDLPVAEVGGEDLLGSTVLTDPHAGRKFGGKVKDSVLAYLFLAPALITFAVFAYYPLYRLFWYATHYQSRFRNRPAEWVGATQLVDTLTGEDFRSGLIH